MVRLRFYDSMSRSVRPFTPLVSGAVGVYSCGPTVYARQHLGNMRPYVFADLLRRTLTSAGYAVRHVINITDVGHLTSDADEGGDKVELAAQRAHVSAQAITQHCTALFQADLRRLNVLTPHVWAEASAHISDQIAMIERLQERGFVYLTPDGVYFDTSRDPHYGELSGLRASAAHSRVTATHGHKRNAADFALWKLSSTAGARRQLEWPSPWGVGFPGWHIECSAMASKYLGERFDIHTGGVDHIAVHHTNEIAQSEAALGSRPWVEFWMHGAWLTMDGTKIAKSAGLAPNLDDLGELGIDPLAFRYYLMTAHYRSPLDLSLEALRSAQTGFERLGQFVGRHTSREVVAHEAAQVWRQQFFEALYEDLDAPRSIAVLWCILADASLPQADRANLIAELGGILGLVFEAEAIEITPEIAALLEARQRARGERDFSQADAIRGELLRRGFTIEDSPDGPTLQRVR